MWRRAISEYPALARTIDEEHADLFWRGLENRTVIDCLPPESDIDRWPGKKFTVRADATLLEVASVMARMHSPIVAVVDSDGRLIGCITLTMLLDHLSLPDFGD